MASERPQFYETNPAALEDPRLKAVIEATRSWRPTYESLIAGYEDVLIINGFQRYLATKLGVPPSELRVPDRDNIFELQNHLLDHGPHGPLVFFRHGAQLLKPETAALDETRQKIEAMRWPNNFEDFLTNKAMLEAATTAIALKVMKDHLAIRYGKVKNVRVLSSASARAIQVAAIFAEIIQVEAEYLSMLDCPNYLPESEMPTERLISILGAENKGSMPWTRTIVDAACGEGTYTGIQTDMNDILYQANQEDAWVFAVGHTQHTNHLDEVIGVAPKRLDDLGATVVWNEAGKYEGKRFQSGIFK
ncbi:hypothetical protein HY024_01155 [Candidatus Curtissbacteria bacterium]|nr:hypothetical protein [Candidatus Curtissbacteria bacterium]